MTKLVEIVKGELSGSKAKSYVAELTRFHRIQGSRLMHAAAEHVRDELGAIGLDEVRIEQYPADGREKYWTYTAVMGWDVRSAELRLTEPHEKLLLRFSDVPQSLHTYSRGTPKGGVEAELVDVGKGVSDSDYAGKDVKGKLVLATGQAKAVHDEAVTKRGAVGVLTDSLAYEFPGVRESMDIPDAHSYQGIWPDAKNAKKTRFGFSLSKRQGNELRKYLESGKTVKLHARVDAELLPGKYSIVSAILKGCERPKEEVFLVAHLCHPMPSANDNASGSGLLIEIARTISALVKSGRIERPKRTIRFLWVPETVGSIIFLCRHPEIHKRLVAGMNLDMVGEDQELCRSTLCMDCTPDSLPSYLNDIVFSMIERSDAEYDKMVKLGMVGSYRYDRTTFSGGSDHAEFNEATIGAPCVGLTQWPDLFYHTSMDTIDKVSEDSLQRVGLAVAASAILLADADESAIHGMASLTCSEGMRRISDTVKKASHELFRLKGGSKEFRRAADFHRARLCHVIDRERKAIMSVARLDEVAGNDRFVEHQATALTEHGSREASRLEAVIDRSCSPSNGMKLTSCSKAETRAKGIVPKRLFKGTLDSDLMIEMLGCEAYQWYRDIDRKDQLFSKKMYEAVNLMDGRRTLFDICRFVSAEYGPTDCEDLARFISDLKRMRLVSF
jgi:aminopeptidase YwaD